MGKPVVHLSVGDAYRLWAPTYDQDSNPLLALEERVAQSILGSLDGLRLVDVCAGTGRWMAIARALGASVIGIDLTTEMLACAARKPGCSSVAVGDMNSIPVQTSSADLAICSFGISYVPSLRAAFFEMARVATRVMISDLHPAAVRAGWTRSFETSSEKCCIAHHSHSLEEIGSAARSAGLVRESSAIGRFGEPERSIFARAGKPHVFDQVSSVDAVFVETWMKPC